MIDSAGNKTDYAAECVPRIGERILLEWARGGDPVTQQYFRVKDVACDLDAAVEHQVSILIIEEHEDTGHWPSWPTA